MNTKSKHDPKNRQAKAGQQHEPKKQGRSSHLLHGNMKLHEQERPETRMTR